MLRPLLGVTWRQRLTGGGTHPVFLCGRGDSTGGDAFRSGETEAVGMAWLHSAGDRTQGAVPSSQASMVAFPNNTKGCSCSACCFFCQEPNDAFSSHLLAYVLADLLQSTFCILSLSYHMVSLSPVRLIKQGASLFTSDSVEPLMGSWGCGGKEQAG